MTYFSHLQLTFDCSTIFAILASGSLLSLMLIYSMPMVLRRGILSKPITHSICRIESTITTLNIMCQRRHIYLRYLKKVSYQEIISESRLRIPFSVVVGLSPTFLLSVDISSLLGSVIMGPSQTSLLTSVQVKI